MAIRELSPGKKILAILIITVLSIGTLSGIRVIPSFLKKQDDIQILVEKILEDYIGTSITPEDAKHIHESFRKAGLRGGPDLDEYIKDAGIDPDILKEVPPQDDDKNSSSREQDKTSGVIFSSLEEDINPGDFSLYSSAIDLHGELLSPYKCEKKKNGIENSIPLSWDNIPEGTKSLAVIMYHYPQENDFSHVNSYLLLWGIDPSVKEIPYGMAKQGDWYMGSNKDGNAISYTSPCSKSPGSHKYTIAIFALSEIPEDLPLFSTSDINIEKFMSAVENTDILAKAELEFIDTRE